MAKIHDTTVTEQRLDENELVISPEEMGELMAIILDSDLKGADKLFYTHLILEGVFSLELYDELLVKLEECNLKKDREIESLREEVNALDSEKEDMVKVKDILRGAVGEMKAAMDHIEEKTFEKIKSLKGERDQSKISKLKEIINNGNKKKS